MRFFFKIIALLFVDSNGNDVYLQWNWKRHARKWPITNVTFANYTRDDAKRNTLRWPAWHCTIAIVKRDGSLRHTIYEWGHAAAHPYPKRNWLTDKTQPGKGPLVGCNSPITYKREEVLDNISVIWRDNGFLFVNLFKKHEVNGKIVSQWGTENGLFFIHVRISFGWSFPGVISGSFFCSETPK